MSDEKPPVTLSRKFGEAVYALHSLEEPTMPDPTPRCPKCKGEKKYPTWMKGSDVGSGYSRVMVWIDCECTKPLPCPAGQPDGTYTAADLMAAQGVPPTPPAAVDLDFRECDYCHAQPGAPILCNGCQHNRRVIARLRGERDELMSFVRDSYALRDHISGSCQRGFPDPRCFVCRAAALLARLAPTPPTTA